VIAALLCVAGFARSGLPTMLTARWRLVGFYGSLAVCAAAVLYLSLVGGIRGANFAPQELLKLSLPVAWAGLLIHYRGAFLAETRSRFTQSPLTLWLYVLGLLTLPLLVFVVMRDFGQFLVIGIAQVLLLAYFTRSALYVVVFVAGFVASSVILLSSSGSGQALFTVLGIVVAAVIAIAALERFRRRDALWTSASLVLVVFVALAMVAVRLSFVQEMLATPRARFMLWADLFSRNGNPGWWDNSRQVIESLYALDAGGVLGHGIGRGTPFLIPKASSDFIFSAIAEELGVAGAFLVILSFGAIVAIGLRAARDVGRDSFLGLMIAGYVLLIGAQAFVHITGTMNVLPMTGITLPLVSSGMSSLVVAWGMIGCVIGLAAREAIGRERFVIRKPPPGPAA
jgi:cell division protein FtsW (lipid II flippase)